MNNNADENELMELLCRKFKEKGLKITPQRIAVYHEFLKAKDHPSADNIYRKLIKKIPNISFDTINRTLLMFHKIGFADTVEGSGQPKRFDPNIDKHHHCRCIQCNKIIDFYNADYDNITVPKEIKGQFTVLNKKVVLEGLCEKCRGKGYLYDRH